MEFPKEVFMVWEEEDAADPYTLQYDNAEDAMADHDERAIGVYRLEHELVGKKSVTTTITKKKRKK